MIFQSVFRKMEWQWEKRVGKGQVVQPNGTSWDKLEYVGQVEKWEGGLQILVGQVGQGEGGLQIFVGQVGQGQGVCPAEPVHLSQSGTTRLWIQVFLCRGSWPQLQLRNEGTPPDFKAFFLEKRPWKRFSTNVLIWGVMSPLHKLKVCQLDIK